MLQLQIITYTDNKVKLCIVMDLLAKTIITPSKIIDLMQLRTYLIRNQAPHVINSHVHDSRVYMNRQLLDEATV